MKNPPKKLSTCPNCQTPLEHLEPYCPTCGQKNEDILLPVKAHLQDAFESVFNWDSRLLRTLKVMFTEPGRLTIEFNEGKRKRFVPPLRMYLIASLLFFLLLSISSKSGIEEADKALEGMVEKGSDTLSVGLHTINLRLTGDEIKEVELYSDTQMDSFLLANGAEPGLINKLSLKQSLKVIRGNVSGAFQQFTQAASIGMFLLMPAFAAILMLIFRKPKRYYVEHLICSVHLHTLAFLILSLNLFFIIFYPSEIINGLLNFAIIVYVLLYLKNIYQKKWIHMFGYYSLVSLAYLILFIALLLVVGVISLFFF